MDAAQAGEGKLAFTLRVPIGVVGAISPFNFPLNLVAHKLAPALAAGCAGRAQAREPDAALGARARRARTTRPGCPPAGSTSSSGRRARSATCSSRTSASRAITFTGSREVGWKLRERAPRKKVAARARQRDAGDRRRRRRLDEAAAKLAANAFSFAGQSCISVQRIYVQKWVYDDFVDALRAEGRGARGRRPGRRGRPTSARSSTTTPASGSSSWIEEARDGGRRDPRRRRAPRASSSGRPCSRTSTLDMKVCCEEVFGPVVRRQRLRHARRGDRARQRHALRPPGGDLHGRHPTRRCGPRSELEFGGVIVNEAPTFRADQMPYGGVKDSGNTREGPAYAVRELTEERVVVIDL